jgi:hypothetical protein
MSPDRRLCWALWGAVSSGLRWIEIGWNLWGMLPHLLPQRGRFRKDRYQERPGPERTFVRNDTD